MQTGIPAPTMESAYPNYAAAGQPQLQAPGAYGSQLYGQQPNPSPGYPQPGGHPPQDPYATGVLNAAPPVPQGGYPGYGTQQQQQPPQAGQYGMQQQQPAGYPPQQQQQQSYFQDPNAMMAQQQHPQQQMYQQQQAYGGMGRPESVNIHKIPLGTAIDHPGIPHLLPQTIVEEFQKPVHVVSSSIEPLQPRSVRPTFNVIPGTKAVTDLLPLPIGICINPVGEGADIPEASFPNFKQMVRCGKCNAYINPFTMFTKNGAQYQCIMCKTLCQVPERYYCPLDPQTNLRQDRHQRPELLHCSVDLIATPEFLTVPPRRPVMVLLLDCSHAAATSGLLAAMCRGSLRALEELKNDEFLHMAIVAYDSSVHFFQVLEGSEPQMITSPDVVTDLCHADDKFHLNGVELPCPVSELVVPVRECYQLLRMTLTQLPTMSASQSEAGCAFGPAINVAMTLLAKTGGKIIAGIASNPSHGEGAVKQRFDPEKLSKQPKEYTMCQPGMEWYKERSLSCSATSISVDLVVGPAGVPELSTIAPIARYTGGHIYHATATSMGGLARTVERCLTRFTAYDAILRVRTSPGVMVTNFYGHFHVREADLLTLPVVDEDTGYAVEIALTPQFKGKFAYVQFATIFTTRARQRRIRVHTLQLRVGDTLTSVVNSIDSLAMASLLTRMCVDKAFSSPFADAQAAVTKRLTDSLRNIQVQLNMQGMGRSQSELNIPESMKYVPQIIAAFFRFAAVGAPLDRAIPPSQRIANMAMIMNTTPEAAISSFMGWTYALYNPSAPVEELPAFTLSTLRYFTDSTVYLTHTGTSLVLWVGNRVDGHVLDGLHINLPRALEDQMINPKKDLSAVNERLGGLVAYLQGLSQAAYSAAVEVSPQGNKLYESVLARFMTESSISPLVSYGDYLKILWKQSEPVAGKK